MTSISSNTLPRKIMATLAMAVVPMAAFLAFSIQPMMGKHLLPIYGGSVGTWLGTMLYFQLALLSGYSWAAWLVHRPKNVQVYATLVLAIVGLVLFRLPSVELDAAGSIWRILWSLSITTLPAMILLFSLSTLMHSWLQHREQAVPYYLYAFSNVGSLAALLLYPFYVEPWVFISKQALYWLIMLFVVTCMLAIAGLIHLRTDDSIKENIAEPDSHEPWELRSIIMWLALSAMTCIGMLGATHHISVEIGSNPLSWTGPFGIYLLSFAIIFSGRWQPWMTRLCIAWLGISIVGFMLSKGFTAATVNGVRFWWVLSLTAAGSFLGNALIYSLRPKLRFERFYLMLAAGGVIGGLLSSIVIPHTFTRPLEFTFVSILLLTIGMLWLMVRRDILTSITVIIVVAAPILGIGLHQDETTTPEGVTIQHFRDLYGHSMLNVSDESVVLSSETTTHGSQLTGNAESRKRPTLYYTESTAVGRAIEKLKMDRISINVGVIGLGAGTLAAYAQQGDHYDFWDIDPKSIRIANENFSFIKDAPPATVNIMQQDGRIGIQKSNNHYDLIVIDAFSGDGVPPHLLTREAMEIYFNKLKSNRGLLLIHASTRYSKIFPVAAATANSLGWSAVNVFTNIKQSGEKRDWDPTSTDYIIIGTSLQISQVSSWFAKSEENGRVLHTLETDHAFKSNQQLIWSDERNSALDVINLEDYLFVD